MKFDLSNMFQWTVLLWVLSIIGLAIFGRKYAKAFADWGIKDPQPLKKAPGKQLRDKSAITKIPR